MRLARGAYDNGVDFTTFDNWRSKTDAHRELQRPWTGTTTLFEYTCDDTDAHVSQLCSMHEANYAEMTQCKHVRFDDEVTTHEISPYSEAYHDHPHRILATRHG